MRRWFAAAILMSLAIPCCAFGQTYTINTFAGNGTQGYSGDNGPAASAELGDPLSVAVDSSGNVYIADQTNNRVLKVANGVITTVAGNGQSGYSGDDGPATIAQLRGPGCVAVDSAGNLFIVDQYNNRIRKVANGVITTVAGNGQSGYGGDNGPATSAQLNTPTAVAVDSAGNLFIADFGNERIRKVSNGVITTVAGSGSTCALEPGLTGGCYGGDNGPATSADLFNPFGVAVDNVGNLYIADTYNSRVREVSNGVITTVAGDGPSFPAASGFSGDNGPATDAQLHWPNSLAVDSAGDLFIADTFNQRIRKVASGVITTIAGNGTAGFSGDNGPATSAQLNYPEAVAVDSAGNLFIADPGNSRIRLLIPTAPAAQDISFAPLDDVAMGVAPFTITATASSGLTVSFASSTPEVCTLAGTTITGTTVTGTTVTIVGGGICSITASQAGSANYLAATPVIQGFTVTAASGAPIITQGGVGPADSKSTTIQPGSWISIYGTNLASATATWDGDFPTILGDVTVTIDGYEAYLSYVSPTQINLQAPDDTRTGSVGVTVANASGSWTSTVTLGQAAPAFLLLDITHVAGIILRSNGLGAYGGGAYDIIGPTGSSLGYPTVAAKQGDVVELFGTGFGPTNPAVPAGHAFSSSAPTANAVQLAIGGTTVTPSFAGLSAAGLDQINLTIPVGLGTGDLALVASVGGIQAQSSVVISLQ